MSKFLLKFAVFILLIGATVGAAKAQDSLKISRIDSPPKIDGVLSVDEWKDAIKTEIFHQKERQENDKLTERTEVFLAFDKEIIYVAFHAFDSNPMRFRSSNSHCRMMR